MRGRGGRLLVLPSLHVTAVTSVTEGETLLTVDEDYTWSTNGVVTSLGYWGHEDVAVVMTHGYPSEDLPADVTGVVQAVAQRAYSNPTSVAQGSAGPFSERRAGVGAALELLDAEKAILRPYRIPGIA